MGKEIERKWLCDAYELKRVIQTDPYQRIEDYYFNEYCRLRKITTIVNNNTQPPKYFITIKSPGHLIRDEFEFEVNSGIEFTYKTCLKKRRYKFDYKGTVFEVNVFQDIGTQDENSNIKNLITIECEYDSLDTFDIEIPEWFGKEITEDSRFYGYELFNSIQSTGLSIIK